MWSTALDGWMDALSWTGLDQQDQADALMLVLFGVLAFLFYRLPGDVREEAVPDPSQPAARSTTNTSHEPVHDKRA